ncbi:hypothetical protein PENTCL1PPCAC_7925, partial [Pristionchus entomophagus]
FRFVSFTPAMPDNWESGPPWGVVTAAEVIEKKLNESDIIHTDKEEPSDFSVPIALTISLVLAILASLLIFFIRRYFHRCLTHQVLHRLPIEQEVQQEKYAENGGIISWTNLRRNNKHDMFLQQYLFSLELSTALHGADAINNLSPLKFASLSFIFYSLN